MKGLLDYMLWNNVFPSDALVLIPPLIPHPCDLLSILNNVLCSTGCPIKPRGCSSRLTGELSWGFCHPYVTRYGNLNSFSAPSFHYFHSLVALTT